MNTRTELFPPLEPYDSGFIDLDGTHRMYWEQSGNPRGVPVLFLHGGPGAGSTPAHRRFFDPAHYRIVVYDQRGAGRSVPLGHTADNTTAHLIADAERLRELLEIPGWFLFGGSWGSTLALAYAQAHPKRCRGMVLRGIFLGTRAEIDWFLTGMRRFFPEAWREFAGYLPEAEREDLLASYHARLTDEDPGRHLAAARRWSGYEAACSTLMPNPGGVAAFASDKAALGLARIEAHYFVNDVFLRPGQLMDGLAGIRHLPCTIVQGRYDMICPLGTADALARAWPEAELVIVPDAGHAAMEPGIRGALVGATERYKRLG